MDYNFTNCFNKYSVEQSKKFNILKKKYRSNELNDSLSISIITPITSTNRMEKSCSLELVDYFNSNKVNNYDGTEYEMHIFNEIEI